jgi:lysophospholipase L1-like esterase
MKPFLIPQISRRRCGYILLAVLACTAASASEAAHGQSLRFTFGTRAQRGFTLVQADDQYTPERGYGFLGAPPDRDGESICGNGQPFLFAVDVSEGNYDVIVRFGSDKSDSVTTLKAEARRLLLEKLAAKRAHFETRTFTVNVRYPGLRTGESVHLKPDEQSDFDWDRRLSLEFNGARPCVQSIDIVPNDHAVTVYIVGDSTVTDQRREPWAAWGQMLPRFFGPGVAIANHAESGESLKTFIGERRWPKVLETIKPGDYVLIQFAHNDQKPGPSHVDPSTSYQQYLQQFMDDAKQRGAVPVLVTSMHRRKFDTEGKIVNTLGEYPEAMRQLAAREHVPLIDLNAMSQTLFETLGPDGTLKAFVHYPAGSFPGQDKPLADDTHFNNYGGYELARCVVEGVKANRLKLAKHLAKDVRTFDPARPDPASSWSLPASPQATSTKPEGN